MRKIGVFFSDRAMRNACDSDSRCGLACDASARDAKSLAIRVERREPLRLESLGCTVSLQSTAAYTRVW